MGRNKKPVVRCDVCGEKATVTINSEAKVCSNIVCFHAMMETIHNTVKAAYKFWGRNV